MPPIQIKRQDVVEDVRALAALTGCSITDAIGHAVRSQLAVERTRSDKRLARRLRAAQLALEELRQLPVVGRALSDRDLYDDEGLPK